MSVFYSVIWCGWSFQLENIFALVLPSSHLFILLELRFFLFTAFEQFVRAFAQRPWPDGHPHPTRPRSWPARLDIFSLYLFLGLADFCLSWSVGSCRPTHSFHQWGKNLKKNYFIPWFENEFLPHLGWVSATYWGKVIIPRDVEDNAQAWTYERSWVQILVWRNIFSRKISDKVYLHNHLAVEFVH